MAQRGDQPGSVTAAGVRPGSLLADRYELGEELGRGGMGRVYRTHDRLLGRNVAVKILADDDLAEGDFARTCAREARAVGGLVHPGIVTVYDIGVHDGQSFLVMELVHGPTLRQLLRDGPLSPARAVEIAAQVADALDYAHRQGVLHCDVKPHNIMLRDEAAAPPGARVPTARAKLVDFGIARAANVTGTFAGAIAGSVPYMAPEQVLGELIDGRTDVYALGVVLYEMLVGRPPFEGGTAAAVLARRLTVDAPPPRSLNPAIPRELERVVLTALRREPERRYRTAGRFRDALHAVESAADPVTRAMPAAAQRPPSHLSGARGGSMAYRRQDGVGAVRLQARPRAAGPGLASRVGALVGTVRAAAGGAQLQAWPRLGLGIVSIAILLGLGPLLAALSAPAAPRELAAPAASSATVPPVAPELAVPAAPADPTTPAQPTAPAESGDGAGLPGIGWATFGRLACEWSAATTPPAICFGTRPAGFRVRVLGRDGNRWLIWDPETHGVGYVNLGVLELD